MKPIVPLSTFFVAAATLLTACGGGSGNNAVTQVSTPARGTLVQGAATRTASLTAAEFSAQLQAGGIAGQTLLSLATGSLSGNLTCGVDVQRIQYTTVGGKGEATQASAAVMVPTGSDASCTGARPVVLFAHGTAVEKRYNLAALGDTTNPASAEASLIASQFAAKGFIVVAPNYAGYDSSTLTYHPFLVADQQSKDMMDALAAARLALPQMAVPVSDNGKLFITGISQGGHVAMATHKAMRALGMNVTASAPIEPVTAPLAYADYVMSGRVPRSSTVLLPMLLNGYQKTYGTLYAAPTDYYTARYAAGIEAAFPGSYSYETLITSAVVPPLHLFSGDAATAPASFSALFASGVGADHLITDTARANYLRDVPNATPTFPLRVALQTNDMTTFAVDRPMLICAGSADPTVFYSVNAERSANAMATNPMVKLLDLENSYPNYTGSSQVTGPNITGLQAGFALAKAGTGLAAGTDAAAQAAAVMGAYHGTLVPPFCTAAASGFFSSL